jgi:hypothetical protein
VPEPGLTLCETLEVEVRSSNEQIWDVMHRLIEGLRYGEDGDYHSHTFLEYKKAVMTKIGKGFIRHRTDDVTANAMGNMGTGFRVGGSFKMEIDRHELLPGCVLTVSREIDGNIIDIDQSFQCQSISERSVSLQMDPQVKVVLRVRERVSLDDKEDVIFRDCEVEVLDYPDLRADPKRKHKLIDPVMASRLATFMIDNGISGTDCKAFMGVRIHDLMGAQHTIRSLSLMPKPGTRVLLKADGVKVWAITNGIITAICNCNREMKLIGVSVRQDADIDFEDVSVVCLEMMENGDLIYISTSMSGGIIRPRTDCSSPDHLPAYLRSLVKVRTEITFESEEQMDKIMSANNAGDLDGAVKNDGFVEVRQSIDYRFKKVQTVDLMVEGGLARAGGSRTVLKKVSKSNIDGIYEFTIYKNRRLRLNRSRIGEKLVPDTMLIVEQIMSCADGVPVSRFQISLSDMSFSMRRLVYGSAMDVCKETRIPVIISIGTGRLQELWELDIENYLIVCVDPDVNVRRIPARSIVTDGKAHDRVTHNIRQAARGLVKGILPVKMKGEDFVRIDGVSDVIDELRIPMVFL